MSGRPRPHGAALNVVCTGDWACDGRSHCSCWWDAPLNSEADCCCGDIETYDKWAKRVQR